MKCPVDSSTLLLSERQGVEIDYCPQCRGVWLDRGELDKLLQRADDEWRERDHDRKPHYDDDRGRHHDDGYERRRPSKKKGFLSEIFDFD